MKRALLVFALLFSFMACVAFPHSAEAAWNPFNNNNTESVCRQSGTGNSAVCQASSANPISGTNGVIIKVVRIIATIGGVIAVIMMIVGGIMYITSDGDAGKVTSAKNTLIYAGVGLVVIALGQTLVVFIITRIAPNGA
ncbi:MAG TPA: pilin [Candidatus Saccharimonadales bacterium]|nr:pilin [Candidatus Saccharimonadales bacterium]